MHILHAALLPLCPSDNRLMGVDWTPSFYSTCYFVFSTNQSLKHMDALTREDLRNKGFLPSGLFERLLARGCIWSHKTNFDAMLNIRDKLFKNVAQLEFGGQSIRVKMRQDINCIQMDVQGLNPLGAYYRVRKQIKTIMKECMQSLAVFAALEIPLPTG